MDNSKGLLTYCYIYNAKEMLNECTPRYIIFKVNNNECKFVTCWWEFITANMIWITRLIYKQEISLEFGS